MQKLATLLATFLHLLLKLVPYLLPTNPVTPVASLSLIVFEIMTNESPFSEFKLMELIIYKVTKNYRPKSKID